VDSTKNNGIRTISFCAGYGGIERGIESTGERIVPLAICEIEAYAIANTIAKMEAGQMVSAPMWTDLKTFPLDPFRGACDLLTGGFPCQPFSSAGARKGDDDPRHLFPYFLRAIRGIKPGRVFLENVQGLLSAKLKGSHWSDPEGTPVLLHVLRELERVGYRVETGIFSARETGAPHQRKRVFILAELADPDSNDARRVTRELHGKEEAQRVQERDEDCKPSDASSDELADHFSVRCRGRETTPDPHDREGVQVREGRETRVHLRCETQGCGGAPGEWNTSTAENSNNISNRDGRTVQQGRNTMEGGRTGLSEEWGSQECNTGPTNESCNLWPSRPNEPQHEWEESRVIPNSDSEGLHGQLQHGDNKEGWEISTRLATKESVSCRGPHARERDGGNPGEGTNKPELGGTAHGPTRWVDAVTNRVDRLRMCGNGVVPQTAAIAWRVLNEKISGRMEVTSTTSITGFLSNYKNL